MTIAVSISVESSGVLRSLWVFLVPRCHSLVVRLCGRGAEGPPLGAAIGFEHSLLLNGVFDNLALEHDRKWETNNMTSQ